MSEAHWLSNLNARATTDPNVYRYYYDYCSTAKREVQRSLLPLLLGHKLKVVVGAGRSQWLGEQPEHDH